MLPLRSRAVAIADGDAQGGEGEQAEGIIVGSAPLTEGRGIIRSSRV